jgi:ABC-type multidrug transport system fused ATPase/permease subunit
MLNSLRRTLLVFRKYRGRLVVSQLLVLISALSIIGLATLTQRLINEGVVAENSEAILRTGFWMFILALVAGFALAGAAKGTADFVST